MRAFLRCPFTERHPPALTRRAISCHSIDPPASHFTTPFQTFWIAAQHHAAMTGRHRDRPLRRGTTGPGQFIPCRDDGGPHFLPLASSSRASLIRRRVFRDNLLAGRLRQRRCLHALWNAVIISVVFDIWAIAPGKKPESHQKSWITCWDCLPPAPGCINFSSVSRSNVAASIPLGIL